MISSVQSFGDIISKEAAFKAVTAVAATGVAAYLATKTIVPLDAASGAVVATFAALGGTAFSQEGATVRNVAVVALSTLAGIAALQYGLPTLLAKAGLAALPTINLNYLTAFNVLGQVILVLIPRCGFPTTNEGIKNFGIKELHEAVTKAPEKFAALPVMTQVWFNGGFEANGLEAVKVKVVKEGSEEAVEVTPTLTSDVIKAATDKEIRNIHEFSFTTEADKEKGIEAKTTTWVDLVDTSVKPAFVERLAVTKKLTAADKANKSLEVIYEGLSVEAQWRSDLPLHITAERLAAHSEEKLDAPSTSDKVLKLLGGMKDAKWITLDVNAREALNEALKRVDLKIDKPANPSTAEDVKGLDEKKLKLFYNNFALADLNEDAENALVARFFEAGMAPLEGNLGSIVVPITKEALKNVKGENQIRWLHKRVTFDLPGIKPSAEMQEALTTSFSSVEGLKTVDFSVVAPPVTPPTPENTGLFGWNWKIGL